MKHAINILSALFVTISSILASGPLGEWRDVPASFTRPNDAIAYASGDLVANSTTAGSVVPIPIVFGAGGVTKSQVEISRIRLAKSTTGVPARPSGCTSSTSRPR